MIIRLVFDLPAGLALDDPRYGSLTLDGPETVEVHLPEGATGWLRPAIEKGESGNYKTFMMLSSFGGIHYANGKPVKHSEQCEASALQFEEEGFAEVARLERQRAVQLRTQNE